MEEILRNLEAAREKARAGKVKALIDKSKVLSGFDRLIEEVGKAAKEESK